VQKQAWASAPEGFHPEQFDFPQRLKPGILNGQYVRAKARTLQLHSIFGQTRMTRALLAMLAFYRRWISPAIHTLSPGHGCKFMPTCSEYASVAIATHGALRGTALAFRRLLRCHPFTLGGLDLVPPPHSCILHAKESHQRK